MATVCWRRRLPCWMPWRMVQQTSLSLSSTKWCHSASSPGWCVMLYRNGIIHNQVLGEGEKFICILGYMWFAYRSSFKIWKPQRWFIFYKQEKTERRNFCLCRHSLNLTSLLPVGLVCSSSTNNRRSYFVARFFRGNQSLISSRVDVGRKSTLPWTTKVTYIHCIN